MMLGKGTSSSSNTKMVDGAEDMATNKNFSVLVVDDVALIRKLHDMLLKKFGLTVQAVENGKEAIDLFLVGANFDLILMDKEMPVMNGVEATKELRGMGVDTMIVGVTSRDTPYEKQDFMEAGLDYCLAKPLTPEKISFLLQELHKKN